MADPDGLDVLVIGGGITGAGIALDATTRGLRTGIVEMQDWAAGTSSRSSRLVHGGLRYLYNLDFGLVAEALSERGLLLEKLAPHLVTAQPFLWPLKTPVVERGYSAVGVGLYDTLAQVGSHGARVPIQKHYSRTQALERFPDLRPDQLVGAIRFYDARVDDARLVIALVRTAARYGAYAASRTQAVGLVRDGERVTGAEIADLETGARHTIRASRVISATGVWTEDTERLAGLGEGEGLKVLASKGIHLVFDRSRIRGDTGLFLRTEKSVLFIIPWQRYWVIGTTDTVWEPDRLHPVATAGDIDYVLEQANAVLASNLTRADVISTWAGLRPLLQPADPTSSTKVSREHTVSEVAPGLIVIAGGKLTTYRAMAEDAVDFALGARNAEQNPSITDRTPLVGGAGVAAAAADLQRRAPRLGWDDARIEHLISRYGSDIADLLELIDEHPDWLTSLTAAPAYLRAEAAYAVLREGALHLEDILLHRLRLAMETPDRGVAAMAEICEVVAPLLGWSAEDAAREQQAWRSRVAAVEAAGVEADDASAASVRLAVPDLVPLHRT
ncbi:MAG: glycerol-3-phosphate dehydrogenase/oxidase [Propionibacteriaceae bacterium]|nr:glycerol-3-phosphate dehydrogenase/oxidase [Propionibacteriaceae bacterium]